MASAGGESINRDSPPSPHVVSPPTNQNNFFSQSNPPSHSYNWQEPELSSVRSSPVYHPGPNLEFQSDYRMSPHYDSYRNRNSLPNFEYGNPPGNRSNVPNHPHRTSLGNPGSYLMARPLPPSAKSAPPDWSHRPRTLPSVDSRNQEESSHRNRSWEEGPTRGTGISADGVGWEYRNDNSNIVPRIPKEADGSWGWSNPIPNRSPLPWLPPPPLSLSSTNSPLLSKLDSETSASPLESNPGSAVEAHEEKEEPVKKGRKPRRRAGEPPRDLAQRRYHCELCVIEPRSFARPSALKIHMLTHTKEKPHVCPVCSRAFAIASNLKRHQRLHDNNEEETFTEKNPTSVERWQAPLRPSVQQPLETAREPWRNGSGSGGPQFENGSNGNGGGEGSGSNGFY